MSRLDDFLAWRERNMRMTPQQRAQQEINQWIWMRWFFTAVVCLFVWGGVVIFNEGHGFRLIHFVAFGVFLWAAIKGWKLKIRRDREGSA